MAGAAVTIPSSIYTYWIPSRLQLRQALRLPLSLRMAALALTCCTLLACGGGGGLGDDGTAIVPPDSTPSPTADIPPATTTGNPAALNPPPVSQPGAYRHYDTTIKRTQYGIPHVTANDWGSLGFGYGYAFAQDNYCTLLREIIAARGQSARWFGEAQGNADSDFIYTLLNSDDEKMQREWIDVQPPHIVQLVTGYADGLNRYADDIGVANLPQDCRNAPWVSRITKIDMVKFLRKLAQQGSADNDSVRAMIMAVQGPTLPKVQAAELTDAEAKAVEAGLQRLGKPIMDISEHGSNAYALGREATQSGRGMLLGNPHQPWQGTGRFYEVHLTYPGVYDAMGASLFGLPMVNIGFNENIAWSHTISVAARFGFYELKINPANPLQYQYGSDADGNPVWRDISATPVSIQVKLADGTLETRTHTFYRSHYGFITNLTPLVDTPLVQPLLGTWPMRTGTLLTIRDANQENSRGLAQWVAMGQAKTLDQFTQALAMIGIPWVNTLAVDRGGKAYYGDISTVPHIDNAKFAHCNKSPIAKIILAVSHNQVITLNGADPACEWGQDADSPAGTNVFGYSSLPKIYRDDYVANSNDSYWLANPHQPLTGYPLVMGTFSHEGLQQFLRTALAHDQVAKRLDGSDGLGAPKFTLENLQQVMFGERVLGAERTLVDMLEICSAAPRKRVRAADSSLIDITRACEVLASWDRTVTLDAIGAQIFTETWKYLMEYFGEEYVIHKKWFWAQPFDPANPLATPSGINKDYFVARNLVLEAIATAVKRLQDNGVALDAPWRNVQYVTRNGEDIPIHGGYDWMGTFSVTKVNLEQGGYRNVHGGNTYIQTVTWDDSACPLAFGILAHSQSTDPDDPFYADQTKLYSQKVWPKLPFCTPDIDAMQIGETVHLDVELGSAE